MKKLALLLIPLIASFLVYHFFFSKKELAGVRLPDPHDRLIAVSSSRNNALYLRTCSIGTIYYSWLRLINIPGMRDAKIAEYRNVSADTIANNTGWKNSDSFYFPDNKISHVTNFTNLNEVIKTISPNSDKTNEQYTVYSTSDEYLVIKDRVNNRLHLADLSKFVAFVRKETPSELCAAGLPDYNITNYEIQNDRLVISVLYPENFGSREGPYDFTLYSDLDGNSIELVQGK